MTVSLWVCDKIKCSITEKRSKFTKKKIKWKYWIYLKHGLASCIACNSILMKHLILLYELLRTRLQSQVSQSVQSTQDPWHQGASLQRGPQPSFVGGCGCRFLVSMSLWIRPVLSIEMCWIQSFVRHFPKMLPTTCVYVPKYTKKHWQIVS